MRPRPLFSIVSVPLPSRLLWVAEIHRFDFLWSDDDDAEIGSRDGIVQVFDLLADFEVFVIVWLIHWLARRWVGERT